MKVSRGAGGGGLVSCDIFVFVGFETDSDSVLGEGSTISPWREGALGVDSVSTIVAGMTESCDMSVVVDRGGVSMLAGDSALSSSRGEMIEDETVPTRAIAVAMGVIVSIASKGSVNCSPGISTLKDIFVVRRRNDRDVS